MEREEIRKNIKSNARNLCEYVVKTSIEYKEELLNLECDILNVKKKNKNLKKFNRNLKEQNDILIEELIEKEKRIQKLINKLGSDNICSICDHFIECFGHLCVYCQTKVCSCCLKICSEGDEEFCNIFFCSSCSITHNKCPIHFNLEEPLATELLSYYEENK